MPRVLPNGWVAIHRKLQSEGAAHCDVSNVVLMADHLLDIDDGQNGPFARASTMLMTAARAMLRQRQTISLQRSALLKAAGRKRKS